MVRGIVPDQNGREILNQRVTAFNSAPRFSYEIFGAMQEQMTTCKARHHSF